MTISVIMANYRGAAFLDAAIGSVLGQTEADLELLVADDASGDGSVDIIKAWQARDARVILLEARTNGGAAAARNRCLDIARGDWIGVVDSDDILHPDRFRRLLIAAGRLSAQMIADDMVFFSTAPDGAGRTLLQSLNLTAPHWFTANDLVVSDIPGSALPPFGYLKPLIARDLIDDLRYDESLPVAEDFDFYLKVLARAGKAVALPDPMYLYRRHSASLSHRLSVDAVQRMIDAQSVMEKDCAPELVAAFQSRAKALRHKLAFEQLVADVKARNPGRALSEVLRRPALGLELARSLKERLARRSATSAPRTPLALTLGHGPAGGATISFPQVPEPDGVWTTPVAPFAAKLTSLAAQHELAITAEGPEAHWALWLVPDWVSVSLTDGRDDLPQPPRERSDQAARLEPNAMAVA